MSTDALAGGWAKALGGDRKQFDMFFDRMLDGFAYHRIVVDKAGKPVDYVFLEVNHAFEKMTGLKRERIIGKRVTEVLSRIEKDSADWIGVYGKVALTGEPVQFENFNEALGKWFKVSAYCPEKGYFVALFEDIIERKKAEETLLSKERELASIYASVPEVLFFLSVTPESGFRFLSVSQSFLRVTGLQESQVVGKSVQEVIPEPSLSLVLEKYARRFVNVKR